MDAREVGKTARVDECEFPETPWNWCWNLNCFCFISNITKMRKVGLQLLIHPSISPLQQHSLQLARVNPQAPLRCQFCISTIALKQYFLALINKNGFSGKKVSGKRCSYLSLIYIIRPKMILANIFHYL